MAGDFNAWNETRLNLVNNLMQKYGLDSVTLSQDERVRFLVIHWIIFSREA